MKVRKNKRKTFLSKKWQLVECICKIGMWDGTYSSQMIEKQLIFYACLKSNCGVYTGLRSGRILGTYWKTIKRGKMS